MAFVERSYKEITDEILANIVEDNRTTDNKITDINVGSVTRTIVEALSREIALLYSQVNRVYLAAFVDTAEGNSLDFVVSILGIKRHTADYASGKVTFSRTTPTPADITIPVGTVITGTKLSNFETTEEVTLAKGKKEIEVSIKATIPGEKGQAKQKNTLTIMPKPVLGIEKVSNEVATELGVNDETDDQLRVRAKRALQGAGKATIDAIKFAAMYQGAKAVEIHEMPQGIPGEINIVVDCDLGKKENVQDAIEVTRAAGIRVNLLFTEKVMLTMTLQIILDQSDLLEKELLTIKGKIEDKIKEYISGLKPGEKVLANKIIALALSIPNVHNVMIGKIKTLKNSNNDDTVNRVLGNNDIVIGKFEKAELEILSFEITFGEKSSTYLDLKVEAKLTTNNAIEEQEIKQAIESRIKTYISRIERQVSFDEILKAMDDPYDLRYSIDKDKTTGKAIHSMDGIIVDLCKGAKDNVRDDEVVELRKMEVNIIK